MYCENCGKEIHNNAILCVNCGTYVKDKKDEEKSFLWGGLGFCIPIVGFILFFIFKKEKPKTSKYCLIAAIVGSIITIIFLISLFKFSNYEINNEQYINDNTYLFSDIKGSTRFLIVEHKNNEVTNLYEKNYMTFENLGLESEEEAEDLINNYQNAVSRKIAPGITNDLFYKNEVIIETLLVEFSNLNTSEINRWFGFMMPESRPLEYLLNYLKKEGLEVIDEDDFYFKRSKIDAN